MKSQESLRNSMPERKRRPNRSVVGWLLLLSLIAALVATASPAAAKSDRSDKPDAESDEPDWFVDEESLPFEALEGSDAEQMWGVHRNAGYRIEVPANWNGDLIMFTHGFRGTDARLFFQESEFPDGYRQWMLDEGYAWAMSTYAKNDYNVTQGVFDTYLLTRQFKRLVAKPGEIYVAGYSMGGHIAAVSAEYLGRTYSGAMPMCGVVGDYELFDYFLDANVAGQHLALGRSQFPVADDYLTNDVVAMKDALGMNPDPESWFFFQGLPLTESGEQYKQLLELRSGGDRPNYDAGFTYWNSIPTASGLGNFLWELGLGDGTITGQEGVGVDNAETIYQVDLDPAISNFERQLNTDIARIAAEPNGRASARPTKRSNNPPVVTGKLKMPVLTLHNLGDLFVPFHNEIEYANDAAAQGKDHLLVQRAIRGVAHCGFTSGEMIEGMSDLINWAENGVKPAGDIVTDPAVVASSDYGCTFTRQDDEGHTLDVPCPEPAS